jgi:2-polyprenyl-3-methyl-5-hydroxy-6-metoxy-1,4-benzoquinol methylase
MDFVKFADKKRVDFITGAISKYVSSYSIILDIGCGNGIITKAIGEMGHKVTGTDVSEKTIWQARTSSHHPNVTYKVTAASTLEAEPSHYDAIICSEVLEHLKEPQLLLAIIHRSLKENGILIVTVPNGWGPREVLVTRPVQYIQKKNNFLSKLLGTVKSGMGYKGTTVQSSADDLTHIQFFTPRKLKELAASSGFSIITIRKTNFIEQVFPFSLFTKRSYYLQKLDCAVAELLPLGFTSGFMSIWKKI